jgi:hypothetical protein
VVAGVALVTHRAEQAVQLGRQVGVQLDPALEIPEIPVVGAPRLAVTRTVSKSSPAGSLTNGALAPRAKRARDGAFAIAGRDVDGLAHGLDPGPRGPVPGQALQAHGAPPATRDVMVSGSAS